MTEQTTAATEITSAVDSMRTQADQAARAAAEQTRTMKEMSSSAASVAREIKLVTRANRNQSATASRLLAQLSEIRAITERNAEGAQQTQGGTAELIRKAAALTGILDTKSPNGRTR